MPTIKDLQTTQNFELLETIELKSPMQFFKTYMGKFTPWLVLYIFILFFTLLTFFTVVFSDNSGLWFLSSLLLVLIVVLPIHELIHAVVYKFCGAKNVKFKIEWKQLVVYTIADRDVFNAKHLYWVANAPIIIITIVLALLTFAFWGNPVAEIAAFTSLLHVTMCGGDLSIVNFFWINRKKEVYTYDDLEEGKSYFVDFDF